MYYNKYYEYLILKLKIHTSYCNMFQELVNYQFYMHLYIL
jgi:hypothetical protein